MAEEKINTENVTAEVPKKTQKKDEKINTEPVTPKTEDKKVSSNEQIKPEGKTQKEEKEKAVSDDKNNKEKRRDNGVIKDSFDIDSWNPVTGLGKKVKSKEIKDIDEILNHGLVILESEVVDALIPTLEKDLLLIGQAKGKFGGGQRRVFRQTQKKTPEGNKPRFATYAVIGDKDGHVGVGYGKSKETVPAREKSFKNAKMNIMKIKRGCGSWQCNCKNPHSIPFEIEGKCSSVKIILMPAPKGTGLCIEKSCASILKMAGIKDVWSRSSGQTKSKLNLIQACMKALSKLNSTKLKPTDYTNLGIVEGKLEK
jgi:small subunit ribosomal protein S5